MEMDGRRRLGLNQEVIGAGRGESLEMALGLDDHQVHVERVPRSRGAPRRAAGPIVISGTNLPSMTST